MKYIYLILTAAWFLFSTYLSHQTDPNIYETSRQLAEFLKHESWNASMRKAAHVFLFFVLAILFSLTLAAWEVNRAWVAIVLVWCVVDEATKVFIHGRHWELGDCVRNMIGGLVGVIVGMLLC